MPDAKPPCIRSPGPEDGALHVECRPDRPNVVQPRHWRIAKGHLVREVDALGGIMGEITTPSESNFALLNTSRGPAVWSPRAQCDKQAYRLKMREVLDRSRTSASSRPRWRM